MFSFNVACFLQTTTTLHNTQPQDLLDIVAVYLTHF